MLESKRSGRRNWGTIERLMTRRTAISERQIRVLPLIAGRSANISCCELDAMRAAICAGKKLPMLISQPHANGKKAPAQRRQRASCSQLRTRSMCGGMAGCMGGAPAGRLGEGSRAASAQCIEAICDLRREPKTMSHPAWISSASASSPVEMLRQHET